MFLQLKDLASQKLITVPEEGMTFGREGGDAQVQVADMGVSKRHAEVFCEGGAWFLKDLGSSNGTVLANERITDATEILPGDVFQLSKRKFEVLKVVEGEVEEEAGGEDPELTDPEQKLPPAKAPSKAPAKTAPTPGKKPVVASSPSKVPQKAEPPKAASASAKKGAEEELGNASVGEVMAGVPKAIAYYLVNVPLLLLNPFGTIRKAIDDQPRDPMGKMELIAWALPGNVFSGAVGFLAGLIAQLIAGALSIGSLIGGLIVGAIVAVVASVLTGFLFHPVMGWIITKLKGESDARSRTNYFLQVQTAVILAVIPSGVAVIIAALRARFGIPLIGLIPVLMSTATSVLTLFVTFKWMEFFNVVKWFKTVLMVLMVLSGILPLLGIPAALSGGGGHASVASAGSGDIGDAQKEAIERMRAAGVSEDQIKAAEEQYKLAVDAVKAGGAEAVKGAEEAAKAGEAAGEAAKAGAEAAKAGAEVAKAGAEAAKGAAEDTAKAAKEAVEPKKGEEAPKNPPAAVPSGGGYGAWHAKFENIEKRVTEDPTVLRKASVLKLYTELQEQATEAESKVRKDYKKLDPRTAGHLREAELFETSGKTVDELHKALFGR